jgi:DNA invertase Pin-like site-specific DNA recombinase
MGIINSVAQVERDLLIARPQSELTRTKAAGQVFGRPPTSTEVQRAAVQKQIATGASVYATDEAVRHAPADHAGEGCDARNALDGRALMLS